MASGLCYLLGDRVKQTRALLFTCQSSDLAAGPKASSTGFPIQHVGGRRPKSRDSRARSYVFTADLISCPAVTRVRSESREFQFFHGRAAMAFFFAAVVGRHDDDGLFANAGVVQTRQAHCRSNRRSAERLGSTLGISSRRYARHGHVVKMNEEKSWFALANDLDGAIGSSSRTLTFSRRSGTRGSISGQNRPVMDAGDHCTRLLFADYAKDSWENSARTTATGVMSNLFVSQSFE